jgi:aryl-alcohol dehydrogenase-like predicted oxidoreductase
MVGLGGEGILRTWGREAGAQEVIREALAQGITYFDCARVYAGSEGYYGSVWRGEPEPRAGVFQASKSAARDREGALMDLETTLSTLRIEQLDLWQIHDVRTVEDLRAVQGRGGALEAFLEAKSSGRTKFVGVTGHHDPRILSRAVREWPVDSVMMPVNPVEGALGGFLDETLPLALEKGIAVIGMKTLGASHYIQPQAGVGPERLLRYALSQGITVAIVGCSSPQEVRTLAAAGRSFEPMTAREQEELVHLFRPYARKLAYYRGSA